jgi:hypothetical protein
MSFSAAPSEAWSGASCSILSLVKGAVIQLSQSTQHTTTGHRFGPEDGLF